MTHTDLQGLLAGADVSLPWAYRPCEYDDWGFIRGPEKISDLIGPYRPVVCNSRQSDVTEEQMAEHRVAKTDPYEPVGRLVVAAVNALPEHLASLSAKDAEIAALRAALEPFAVAWTFADDADDDEVRCITKNGCHGVDVSAFRRAARALHENPESKA